MSECVSARGREGGGEVGREGTSERWRDEGREGTIDRVSEGARERRD